MKLSMITNLTNSIPNQESSRMGYVQTSSDEMIYTRDQLDRHPSRVKRVRLNQDDHQTRLEWVEDEQSKLESNHNNSQSLQQQPTPIIARFLTNDESEYQEAEGDSPSNSFHSSSSSTLTHSQHSSPLQPTTPDRSQPFPYSWSSEPIGYSKQIVTDEMELLAVIEKQAETYASDPGSEALLRPVKSNNPWNVSTKTHQQSRILQPHQKPILSIPNQSSPVQLTPPNPSLVQDKPFKCSLCTKSFTRNYDLTRHKSSHIDQRQHRCSKCGRSFNRRDALIRHTLVKSCGINP